MTNVEKAREIVDKIVRASNERTELNDYHDVKQSALEMADWKDKQFKEYLEQTKLEYEIERGTLRFGGDVIEKIIKELFGGEGRNRYEQII